VNCSESRTIMNLIDRGPPKFEQKESHGILYHRTWSILFTNRWEAKLS